MELVNAAKHTIADYITAYDKTGQEYLVVVIKATYKIPKLGRKPRPLLSAEPLVISDIFEGEPGLSQAIYECDYAYFKPYCDVVINGSAYTLKETTSLTVEVEVASMKKKIRVTGKRLWTEGKIENENHVMTATSPQSFSSVPLTYDYAFGGSNCWQENNQERVECDLQNPIGCGYIKDAPYSLLIDQLLPCLSYENEQIEKVGDKIKPCALSVLPRNTTARIKFAGTYDEIWRKTQAPYLPEDFDERYFQIVPEDQQIPYLKGGEKVRLKNLSPKEHDIEFYLPKLDNIPVKFLTTDYDVIEKMPVVDTLYIEPDKARFLVVWRTRIPLKRNRQTLSTIAIGHVSQQWWQDISTGKTALSCHQPDFSDEGDSE